MSVAAINNAMPMKTVSVNGLCFALVSDFETDIGGIENGKRTPINCFHSRQVIGSNLDGALNRNAVYVPMDS